MEACGCPALVVPGSSPGAELWLLLLQPLRTSAENNDKRTAQNKLVRAAVTLRCNSVFFKDGSLKTRSGPNIFPMRTAQWLVARAGALRRGGSLTLVLARDAVG